jgi:hypothetical protein
LAFVVVNPTEVDFEAVLDRFYDELLDAEERDGDIADPDIAASLADLTVTVEMSVEADTRLDAQVRAINIGRAALHKIDVSTPGWEAVIAKIVEPEEAELQDA